MVFEICSYVTKSKFALYAKLKRVARVAKEIENVGGGQKKTQALFLFVLFVSVPNFLLNMRKVKLK